ncbi:MAG: hypothetical protein JWM32_761 [Verrucomicrobia bacterium]|nr:hypothetical protein [Verrucomicrobiota bacterium]
MLFWLKKAVSYWLMPLPFCLALVVVGGVIAIVFSRWRRTGRLLAVLGVLLLLIFSNKQVGTRLLRPLENRYAAIPELPTGQPVPASLAACTAIVVLGSGHADRPEMAAIDRLSAAGLARLAEGIRLARALPNVPLIVSGPSDGHGGATHASVLATAAVSLGIDASRIVQVDSARDTDDEAQAIRKHLGPGATFALVTSAFHMPRAMGLMQHRELNPVACPTGFLARSNAGTFGNDWLISIPGLELSTWAIYERLGTLWARLQGKI